MRVHFFARVAVIYRQDRFIHCAGAKRQSTVMNRWLATTMVGATTTLSAACSLPFEEDPCSGSPLGDGYTLGLNGGPIHAGYYSELECETICGWQYSKCAPVIAELSRPAIRCGAAPAASCGPRHLPRPNLPGPCDTPRGFDVEARGWEPLAPTSVDCLMICGIKDCQPSSVKQGKVLRIRCGQPTPAGC